MIFREPSCVEELDAGAGLREGATSYLSQTSDRYNTFQHHKSLAFKASKYERSFDNQIAGVKSAPLRPNA